MALLDRLSDDGTTKEVDGAKAPLLSWHGRIDTVAEDHDGSLTSHHSRGHGRVPLRETGLGGTARCVVWQVSRSVQSITFSP